MEKFFSNYGCEISEIYTTDIPSAVWGSVGDKVEQAENQNY